MAAAHQVLEVSSQEVQHSSRMASLLSRAACSVVPLRKLLSPRQGSQRARHSSVGLHQTQEAHWQQNWARLELHRLEITMNLH